MSVQSILFSGSSFFPVQDPPADANWKVPYYPSTDGLGNAPRMLNAAINSTNYFLDFANIATGMAPANSKGVVFNMSVAYTSTGVGASMIFIAPKDAVDGGATMISVPHRYAYQGTPQALIYSDTIVLPFGTSKTLQFSFGGVPATGTGGTVIVYIVGYI